MSLSRSAKRGISTFSKIQWSPNRAKYHLSAATMIDLHKTVMADPRMAEAAKEAMEILVRNGEAANASLPAVSQVEGYTVASDPEGIALQNVSSQQNDGQDRPEGGPAGSEGSAQ